MAPEDAPASAPVAASPTTSADSPHDSPHDSADVPDESPEVRTDQSETPAPGAPAYEVARYPTVAGSTPTTRRPSAPPLLQLNSAGEAERRSSAQLRLTRRLQPMAHAEPARLEPPEDKRRR